MQMSSIHLVYKNGKFDNDSIKIINDTNNIRNGFKDIIERLSKNFYGFNVSSTNEEINYSTELSNVKGLTVDIDIINIPYISDREEDYKDKRLISLLTNLERYHRLKGEDDVAQLIEVYINGRDQLKVQHKDKYAKIKLGEDIKILDFVPILRTSSNKKDEITFHIGNEFDIKSSVFYISRISSKSKGHYQIPMSVYNPDNKSELIDNENPFTLSRTVVDTGCNITTFNIKILDQIKQLYPDYGSTINGPFSSSMANNTKADTWEGFLDLSFCNYKYENVRVHFMELSVDCLIGTDLVNTGIFTSYFGKQIVFQPVPEDGIFRL